MYYRACQTYNVTGIGENFDAKVLLENKSFEYYIFLEGIMRKVKRPTNVFEGSLNILRDRDLWKFDTKVTIDV